MKFSEELNKYIKLLECSPKELSKASNLSPTLISRYLNDRRIPRIEGEYLNKLVEGINNIALSKKIDINKDEILYNLKNCILSSDIDYDIFINNFNIILEELNVNLSNFAKAVGYDTSFISKIKNNTRKPSDLNSFIDEFVKYIVEKYNNQDNKNKISVLINCSLSKLDNDNSYRNSLLNWLKNSEETHNKLVKNFLLTLDSFNLNDYIGTDFNKIKVPTSPIILRNSKTFYGPSGRKEAEAEFLKTTLISKSQEPIFFYNNLPMAEASNDETFKKNWIVAISMVLKKGLHLNIIHDIDRPINEMFLGLESWIPIYMTGSISPYYLKNKPSNIFSNSHCSSGSCILSGECLGNNLENSKFYFSTKKEELEYYKEKSKYLLSKATPLMKIYKESDNKKFEEFINKDGLSTIDIKNDIFKNISFTIKKNKWVMINKLNSPTMHFVIYNDKLRLAIENFILQK